MNITVKRETYERCQTLMSLLGYDEITYEEVLGSKILTTHYLFVGMIAMARFLDKSEAESLVHDFLQSADKEAMYSILPLTHLLGHFFNLNTSDLFAKKGGKSC